MPKKTSTQYVRAFRERQRANKPPKPTPKTSSKRSKEYRARKKALQNAARAGDLSQDSAMPTVASPEVLQDPPIPTRSQERVEVNSNIGSAPPMMDITVPYSDYAAHERVRIEFKQKSSNNPFGHLEEDAQNWMKYKIMGGSIKLKPGILPQISTRVNKDPLLLLKKPCKVEQTNEKYDRLLSDNKPCSHMDEYVDDIDIKDELLSNIVKTEPSTEPLVEEIFFQAVPEDNSKSFVDSLRTELGDPFTDQIYQNNTTRSKNGSYSHKDIQCNINTRKHMRSKATQIDTSVLTCSRGTSPIIFKEKTKP